MNIAARSLRPLLTILGTELRKKTTAQVAQNSASWNHVGCWLRRIEALHAAADAIPSAV